MTPDLLKAVEELYINPGTSNFSDDDYTDDRLSQGRPKKRTKRARDAVTKELEETFLRPPTSFGPAWLNKLQQYVAN